MKTLKRLFPAIALAAALVGVGAGCGRGGGVPAPTGGNGGGGGPAMVPLVDWVTDLAVSPVDTGTPDTVDDKVSIVIDTTDPAAFDPLLQQQHSN